MQLDKTRIPIRERDHLDVCDLALRFSFAHFKPLLGMLLVGALPCALLNAYLLSSMLDIEYIHEDFQRYLIIMVLLVFFQAHWATSFMTAMLGDVMFMQNVNSRQIIRSVFAATWKMAWCHGVLRGLFPALFLLWIGITANNPEDAIFFVVLAFLLSIVVGCLRGARPFINEIILLEKNPLTSSNKMVQTIHRRSSRLHGPSSSFLFGRSLVTLLIVRVFAYLLILTMWFLPGMILEQWAWGSLMVYFVLPTGLWLAEGFGAVIRFLTYLDLRIRREGWAVELHMRAEAAHLERQLA